MRAETAGDPGPWRQQAILGRGHWDADALRDIVGDYALETLSDEDAVLVIDETGFLKQGKASCGVARQYTGSAGKIANCQIGVFASYVSWHGHAFIDRALIYPRNGRTIATRMKAAHVPTDVEFATKASDRSPHDCARDRREGAVLLRCDGHRLWHRNDRNRCFAMQARAMFWASPPIMYSIPGASRSVSAAPPPQLRRAFPRPLGDACRPVKEPKGHVCTTRPTSNWPISRPANTTTPLPGERTRGLLVRRNIAYSDLAFFSTWCPKGTPLTKLARSKVIVGPLRTASKPPRMNSASITTRHAPGIGWHRHVSLVMLAFAMMAVIRHHANARLRSKKHHHAGAPSVVPDPLVDPGNPPHRHQARPAAHLDRPRLAWSLWRRAHQADARRAHLKRKMQL